MMELSEETARVVLGEKLQEARATTAYAATIFTFYLGINGLLFDSVFIEEIKAKNIAVTAAILTGLVYLLVCFCYWVTRNKLLDDVNYLNSILGNPLKNEQLLPLKYTSYTAGIFSLVCMLFWVWSYA